MLARSAPSTRASLPCSQIHALERHHYPFDDPHVAMILEEAFRRMDMALALPTHLLRVVLACLRSGRRLEGWELAAVLRNAEEVAPQSNVQHICNLLFALGSMGLQAGRDVPHAWLDRMVEHVRAATCSRRSTANAAAYAPGTSCEICLGCFA